MSYVAAEHWLDDPSPRSTIDDLALRYLAAFGPATVADFATFTRLTRLREVFDRLGSRLRTWTDDAGRELFDVADGELADADVPAPVRFLPEYDNVLLSHADRGRITGGLPAGLYPVDARGIGHVLVDGRVQATWHRAKAADSATNVVITHAGLAKRHLSAVEGEARRALALLAPQLPAGDVIVTQLT